MTHFVQCIWDSGSAINYNTAYNEIAYKCLLKAFYGRTNKKKYELQILEHNIRHTNIIVMQDVILIAQVSFGNAKKKKLVVDTLDVEVTRVYSTTNVFSKYN